ncbi:MAG: VOC family protein [SAR202 cluster bacterium]|jgi:methylmalonyl-CoA/ethylmalonyl-CoA epimerase|nr:VOC family protein [SAR202 cluster bacterium]
MKEKGIGEILSRLHHVGVLVKNMDEAIDYYQAMGIGPFEPMGLVATGRKLYGRTVTDTTNVAKVTMKGPITIELVQPVSGESVQKEWLESKGEGINHICFAVDDIEEATSIMTKEGFKVISSADFAGGGGMAYFDTDKVGGFQIELLEVPTHISEEPI